MKIIEEAVSPVIGVMLMIVVTIIIAAVVSGLAGDIGLDKKTAPSVKLSKPVIDYDSNVTRGDLVDICTYAEDLVYGGEWFVQGGSYQLFLPSTVNDQHGLTFTHLGGDPIDLRDLQMGFNSQNLGAIVDWDSRRAQLATAEFEPAYRIGDSCWDGEGIVTRIEITFYDHPEDEVPYTLDELVEMSKESNARYFVKINPETPDDTIIRSGDQFKVYTDDSEATGWAIAAYDSDGHYESFGFEKGTGCKWRLAHKPSGAMLAQGDLKWPDNN